jgi:hypothetical protein
MSSRTELFLDEEARRRAGLGRERTRTLETLIDLFEGHDAEKEIRRLKAEDEGPGAGDTPPEVEALWIEGLRRMGPAARLRMAFDLTAAVRALAAAGIRARHGADLPERELRLRLGALTIDRETMVRAFGWDPEVEGY